MLAKIIPNQVRIDTTPVIKGTIGDLDALRAEIKRRGIDVQRLLDGPPKQIEAVSNEPKCSGDGQDNSA
jgi:hypothetical protein